MDVYDYQLEEQPTMPSLTGLPALIKRAQVLATSALAWLSALLVALTALSQQLNEIAGVPSWATKGLASIIALLGVVVFQVRGRTTVAPADKGLLPPKGPAAEADPNRDVGDVGLSLIFRLLALAAFVIVAVIGFDVITSVYAIGWLGLGLAAWVLAEMVP